MMTFTATLQPRWRGAKEAGVSFQARTWKDGVRQAQEALARAFPGLRGGEFFTLSRGHRMDAYQQRVHRVRGEFLSRFGERVEMEVRSAAE